MAKKLCYYVNFHCCKCPNMEQIIKASDHTVSNNTDVAGEFFCSAICHVERKKE